MTSLDDILDVQQTGMSCTQNITYDITFNLCIVAARATSIHSAKVLTWTVGWARLHVRNDI